MCDQSDFSPRFEDNKSIYLWGQELNYSSLMTADPVDAAQMASDKGFGAREGLSPEIRGLVLRAQAGDREAFEQLMKLHQRQVLGTALRILHRLEDAKDAAQEVFLKLFRNLGRIRAEADLRPWLYRVTVNACHDVARELYKAPLTSLEGEPAEREMTAAPDPGIEATLDRKDRQRLLHQALKTLPFKERTAVVLRDIEGLSTEETARVLGSTAATVRSQIANARIKIRRFCDRSLRTKR